MKHKITSNFGADAGLFLMALGPFRHGINLIVVMTLVGLACASKQPVYRSEPKASSQVEDEGLNIFVPYDEPPAPIGGFEAIQKALKFPKSARNAGIEGTVNVQVLVSEKGEVVDTKIIKSIGHTACIACDEAAVEAVRNVRWKPALKRDEPVAVWFAVPVIFRLK